jgi:outer membrane protein assembly factor BamB
MRVRTVAAVCAALAVTMVPAAVALADDGQSPECTWTQWGGGPAHDGRSCVAGQRGLHIVAQLTVDPFAAQEVAENFGALAVNYPAPLLDEDGNVFVLQKAGTYVSCNPPGSGQPAPCGFATANIQQQVWTQRALKWRHGELVPQWTFTSDWKPLPGTFDGLFQSAMTDDVLYVPGAGGTVFQVDKEDGTTQRRINPFGTTIDPSTYITGGLTVDGSGNLYYNVVHIESTAPGGDAHSWLVKVPRHGGIQMVDYRTLIPSAPKPTDLCYGTFNDMSPRPAKPWPPAPQPDGSPTLPPQIPCLSQQAGANVAPAVGTDGTIFTVTRAHSRSTSNYAFVVALHPDLTLKWAASMRGRLNDACGVLTPYGTGPSDCRVGATIGVDPATNLPPAGEAPDFNSGSATALPDGGVLFGAYTQYNGFRGHLMKFDASGAFAAAFDFGEGITPPVYPHDQTYSILTKDNHYITNGPFLLTSLDANMQVQWQFANTSTQTCERQSDGTITCVDDGEHPDGFEWCISSPAIDRDGTLYGLSEDGYLYVIDNQGHQVERAFTGRAIEEAYTPTAIDSHGRIYAQNNGQLYVLGH